MTKTESFLFYRVSFFVKNTNKQTHSIFV